jgi:hypothetical protein
MSNLSVQEKFRKVAVELLGAISSMISDANDAGLTDVVPNQINAIISILKGYDPDKLVISFIKHNSLWPKIQAKDVGFLLNDVPEIFSSLPIDTLALIEPVKVYTKLSENGYKGSKSEKKFPIKKEDIDGLWLFFSFLVKAACRYNKEKKCGFNLKSYE